METSPGLSVEASAVGFQVRNDAGKVAFESNPVVMWDSAGGLDWDEVGTAEGPTSGTDSSTDAHPSSGGSDATAELTTRADKAADAAVADREGAPATGDRVELMDVTVGDGVVTVRPDAAVLADPELEFPLYLDPSIGADSPTRWGTIRSAWPTGNVWKNGDDQGLGFCDASWVSSCDQDSKHRLLWRFSALRYGSDGVLLKNLDSADIISADFSVYGTHSWDCTPRDVKVNGIDDVDNTVTWNNQPDWMGVQEVKTVSHKAACDNKRRIVWDVTARTKTSTSRDQSWVALGMRAVDESTMTHWKRYQADTAKLTIVFNRAPDVPSSSSMTTEGLSTCASSSNPLDVRTLEPTLQAKGTDPDGQKVGMEFRAVQSGGSEVYNSAWTSEQASGQTHTKKVASGKLQSEKVYWWSARAKDSDGKISDWSGANCYFRPDVTPPATPTATSSVYGRDAVGGGAGVAGSFTFDDAGSGDVVKYWYSFDSDAMQDSVTASGGTGTISFTPQRTGSHVLYVQAEDKAGYKSGDPLVYRFSVDQPSAIWWNFDEGSGTVAADSGALEGGPGGHDLTVSAPWLPYGYNGSGSALDFGGTAETWARSTEIVLDPSESYTVSAMVMPGAVNLGHRMAVSQDAATGSAFKLGYLDVGSECSAEAIQGCWAFLMYADEGAPETAVTSTLPVRTAEPTRLTGVYDAATTQMKLYVCNYSDTGFKAELVGTTSFEPTSTEWTAGGSLQIGRAKVGGSASEFWDGMVDDVRIYDQALDADAVSRICGG
ncbi:LamG-like jellyroll fold domain-containing protein [Isoptericola sediminis]|uniref:LamG domain-containing protein n=1 Tax=Isoptericola sediminis TaxID=2733572 RepID=A0A849KB11_9MICO|nr:LamG-like jellyroll fold domain-containing protein [Isoptericola sediminis]NNU28427.1 LamG domain-containing protein [Isoptericola sediminis]